MKEDQRDKTLIRLKKKADAGGRSAAIDHMCATCIYDPFAIGAGSWRSQVQACTSTGCPLYRFRPTPVNGTDD